MNANPDAETGDTSGWTGSGWGVTSYAAVGAQPYEMEPDSNRLFITATPKATLTQVVSVEEYAEAIDAGTPHFYVKAFVGGTGGSAGALVRARALDEQGRTFASTPQIGAQVGPPTAADLGGRPTMLQCYAAIETLPGTRSIVVEIRSTAATGTDGYALADGVRVKARGPEFLVQYPEEPAEGAGCTRKRVTATPTPTPTPTAAPLTVTGLGLRRREVRFVASGAGRFAVAVKPVGRKAVRTVTIPTTSAGPVAWSFRRLPRGTYRAVVRDAARGRELARVSARFR